MFMRIVILFSSLVLLMPNANASQESGFLNRTVSVEGVVYRYQVFVPANWDKHQKWPVILFLHGAGERGDDGLLQTDVGIGHAIRKNAVGFPFIVVMPQCRRNGLWVYADMQAQALAALEQSIKEFHGDRNRLYLTGISMGGYGTWDLEDEYPGKFAALVPICGGIHGPKSFPQLHVGVADDAKIPDPYADTARRIGKTPVWVFHGSVDDTVPVEESRKMVAVLRSMGANVRYTEYAGVGHESWDRAYAESELVPWLLAQSLR